MRPVKPLPSAPAILVGDKFADLVHQFVASADFQERAKGTRNNYMRAFRLIADPRPDSLGNVPVSAMQPSLVRSFLDVLSDRPGAQRVALTAVKSLESWCLERGLLPRPITTKFKLAGTLGGYEPWKDADLVLAQLHARPDLAQACTLAAATGQRGSDLVRLRWSDLEPFQGHLGFKVDRTQKTGRRLWAPIAPKFLPEIEGWERRPGLILVTQRGKPWTRAALSNAWMRERDQNPALEPMRARGLSLHGLRSFAVIEMWRAGVSKELIGDAIGMTSRMTEHYCRLSDQQRNALEAIKRMKAAQVVPFNLKAKDE